MAGRYSLIAAKRLDLRSGLRLDLRLHSGLTLRPERALRVGLALEPVIALRLLSFRSGLGLDWSLNWGGLNWCLDGRPIWVGAGACCLCCLSGLACAWTGA